MLRALVSVNTPNRWVGSGRTVFDNKGNPVKQYEPYFSTTFEYEYEEKLVKWGVTPLMRYDPLGRLIRTDNPYGTFSKIEFDAWQQTTWDENDTVKNSKWFKKLIPNPAQPPTNPTPEQSAALKAAKHAETSTAAHLDMLGRTFLTIADNGAEGQYPTHVKLDIEGNPLKITDARKNPVMVYKYDLSGQQIYTKSMDAGERWMLVNAVDNPIWSYDSRSHQVRQVYDKLQRPTHIYLKAGNNPKLLIERLVYGEAHPKALKRNLCGELYQHYDGAGVVTNEEYDFKGNLLQGSRQLAKEYKLTVNWNPLEKLNKIAGIANAAKSFLEKEIFETTTKYDALNRPISIITPHTNAMSPNEIRPLYNEANLLEKVEARLQGAVQWTPFVTNINYNAKGQRELIQYYIEDNVGAPREIKTFYTYDPLTFRLTRLNTKRTTDGKCLQNLNYTYDPVGNITAIRDDAQQTIYFNNQVVTANAEYTYDALYRLTDAQGREHIGQQAQPQLSHDDTPRMNLPHPGDGQAMQRYTEKYQYDQVGNILKIIHTASKSNWTRTYKYDEPNPTQTNNRLTSTTVGNVTERYKYDAHGNMTKMPHLPKMEWDYQDQLKSIEKQVVNSGTGDKAYYTYDADGERVRKVVEKKNSALIEQRLYLGGFEIFRRHQRNKLQLERETLHIMDDKRRIALVETKTIDVKAPNTVPTTLTRYQLDNHLGSSVLELDENGKIISYEEYYPYGSTSYQAGHTKSEVSLKRYRYTGKERDEESGFYYHGARYYAAWIVRWIACEPLQINSKTSIQEESYNDVSYMEDEPLSMDNTHKVGLRSINGFSYVECNPILNLDPDGRRVFVMGTTKERQQLIRALERITFSKISTKEYENEKNNHVITDFQGKEDVALTHYKKLSKEFSTTYTTSGSVSGHKVSIFTSLFSPEGQKNIGRFISYQYLMEQKKIAASYRKIAIDYKTQRSWLRELLVRNSEKRHVGIRFLEPEAEELEGPLNYRARVMLLYGGGYYSQKLRLAVIRKSCLATPYKCGVRPAAVGSKGKKLSIWEVIAHELFGHALQHARGKDPSDEFVPQSREEPVRRNIDKHSWH